VREYITTTPILFSFLVYGMDKANIKTVMKENPVYGKINHLSINDIIRCT
jgi:hypothetical protein